MASAVGVRKACSVRLARRPRCVETQRWWMACATLLAPWNRAACGVWVYLSFLGVGEGRRQLSMIGRYLVAPLLLRNVVADHDTKERVIRQSTLDWVIVRPPRLTNGARRGSYRSGVDVRATSVVPRISRADLAEFMLRQFTEDTYVRKTPTVMY